MSSQPIVILQTMAVPVWATITQYKKVVIWWKSLQRIDWRKVACYFHSLWGCDVSSTAEPLVYFCICPSRYSLKCFLNNARHMLSLIPFNSSLWRTEVNFGQQCGAEIFRMNESLSPTPTESSIAVIEGGSAVCVPVCLKFKHLFSWMSLGLVFISVLCTATACVDPQRCQC